MQFGGMLHHILHVLRHSNPACGPVGLIKLDLNDCFHRLHLHPRHALALLALLPHCTAPPPPQLAAVPLVLMICWIILSRTCCSMPKAVCHGDVANHHLCCRAPLIIARTNSPPPILLG